MARKGIYFDGAHCRDSQGKFVPVVQCTGRRKKATGKTKKLEGVYFDGVHCRDSQGKFVPVPQCRGKRKKATARRKR